jgi:PTH1 family peptidyl-tRNA hydrolase
MKLIVGLGNPGSRYATTRHNAGFMVIDNLAERWKADLREGKGDYHIADVRAGEERLLLLKPTTFMNNSGLAVREIAQFHKISPRHILVVCDDAALPYGKIRIRRGGSDGGQNGLKSVIYHLNDNEFPRLRVGIANDMMAKMDLADFVLSRFTEDEKAVLKKIIDVSAEAVQEWVLHGTDKAMNKYNRVLIEAGLTSK